MFVLELTYTAPLEDVDAALPAHRAWLDEQYGKGCFLASGRKEPRDGGVILAVAENRARIEEVAAGDPFVAAGVCEYRITEFRATKTAPELDRHRQTAD
ncbi:MULTISPECIES: YciI family protein [unclassified Streptomyces]|uniref:YciI family protein n=1 Tax=unclassified Streptomyces TaxID=2593676 RepID=UPI003329A1F8